MDNYTRTKEDFKMFLDLLLEPYVNEEDQVSAYEPKFLDVIVSINKHLGLDNGIELSSLQLEQATEILQQVRKEREDYQWT